MIFISAESGSTMKLCSLSKRFIVLLLLVQATAACNHMRSNTVTQAQESASAEKVSPEWSSGELAIMRSLWLGKLPESAPDTGNQVADDPRAIAFGHRLFFDKRLSQNGKVSCAGCHQLQHYFTDGREVATALASGRRNTPTIVGMRYSAWFFLDGRADSLWAQALGPLENPIEHGSNRAHIAHVIFNDADLRSRYEALFGPMPKLQDTRRFPQHAGPVADAKAMAAWQSMQNKDRDRLTRVFVNVGKSIAAYERRLIPAPSRFDRYVESLSVKQPVLVENHLTNDEIAGLKLFIGKGSCTFCHSGPLFTDFGFHNIATLLMNSPKPFDLGRYEGIRQLLSSEFNCRSVYNNKENKSCDELRFIYNDRHNTTGAFKTPSLRNVARTAPYMHGGNFKSLEQVLRHYSNPPRNYIGHLDLQTPIALDEQEIRQLVSFLKTLNSDIDAAQYLLRAP